MNKLTLMTLALALISACGGTPREQTSETKLDMSYRLTPTTVSKARNLKTLFRQVLSESSESAPAIKAADLVLFPLTSTEKGKIARAFPNAATFRCNRAKQRCQGTIRGREVTTSLSQVSEADKLYMDKSIKVSVRLTHHNGHDYIEVCRASGIQLQKFFVWSKLDGFYLKFAADEGDELEKMLVDLGSGGSYPSASCDF